MRAGSGTLEAAQAEGLTELLVVRPKAGQLVAVERDDWSATEAAGYAIADNRTAELAKWDELGLAESLEALRGGGLDLGTVGFEADEVDELLEDLARKAAAAGDLIEHSTLPPPTMAWVLIGLPTVRFGEVAKSVEKIARIPGVLCETVLNGDDDEDGQLEPGGEACAEAMVS